MERITLRVLGYRDQDGWVAHCLETDLVGQGKTYAAARRHLVQLTKIQLSFATQMKDPRLFFHPAPPRLLARYERLCSKFLVRGPGRVPARRALARKHRLDALPLTSRPTSLNWRLATAA